MTRFIRINGTSRIATPRDNPPVRILHVGRPDEVTEGSDVVVNLRQRFRDRSSGFADGGGAQGAF